MTALACAICFLANSKDKAAYAYTAAAMSVVPLLAVGLLAWWYFRSAAEGSDNRDPRA